MAVTDDILRAWPRPRPVMRDHLVRGGGEVQGLVFLMLACFLFFIIQLPIRARWAQGIDTPPGLEDLALSDHVIYAFLTAMMMLPLVLYFLAFAVQLVVRLLVGALPGATVRFAFFWTFLAATPMLMLYSLTVALVGAGPQANLVGIAWIIGLLWIFTQSIGEARAWTEEGKA